MEILPSVYSPTFGRINTRKMGRRTKHIGANDLTARVPKFWAQNILAQLHNNVIMAPLVNRNYENMLQSVGDVVNIQRPAALTAINRTDADAITIQDVSDENIQVTLNQFSHSAFKVGSKELSLGIDVLWPKVNEAGKAIAQKIDASLIGQVSRFMANRYGQLEGLNATTANDFILGIRQVLNDAKCPDDLLRRLVISTQSDKDILSNTQFTDANRVGDDGTALRTANLGMKYNLRFFTSQNTPSLARNASRDFIISAQTTSAYAKGYAGTIGLDNQSATTTIPAGCFVTINGEMHPHRIATANVTTPGLSSMVLDSALAYATLNDAEVRVYRPYVSNNASATLASGWSKGIPIDGFTAGMHPRIGQLVVINDVYYCITDVGTIASTSCVIYLDRPLESALTNDSNVFPLPVGSYNFAFHKNAITLVTRPLETEMANMGGVSSYVAAYDGYSVRATIGFDTTYMSNVVIIDVLWGVQVLDSRLGACMLG